MSLSDILLHKESVEGHRFLEVDNGGSLAICISCGLSGSLARQVGLEHLVNHLLEGYATQTVVGMYASVGGNGKVEQQGGVAAHRLVICVHQF